jgi:hypothetical protein
MVYFDFLLEPKLTQITLICKMKDKIFRGDNYFLNEIKSELKNWGINAGF